ncbi:glucuronate isomerase [Amphiplicatus metriothermophilus]|uniref:Uronate isomerase n=1 Tax=Amphiplicatus metriothermophilus TaxID=1519374 RepID=A0A239PWC9_9PROT|nr:glucuronate isomerase [Amphiplicatus metriothermophilus]MBB5518998.1 glucuronate isomerase [Amphiplicatus metriothermophilus]SNT74621.1 glucuronate isomerase [Amphiplicatus metriothermophilus]
MLHPDRLFPPDPTERAVARRLFRLVESLPIVSPHGHTDPAWFARNEPFPDPANLLIVPDHYIFRMLYSQGLPLESLGVRPLDGSPFETDPREIWRRFAAHYYLFRGTPTRIWTDWVLHSVFDISERLNEESADRIYDRMEEHLAREDFRPRALFERFNIETLATTESPLDDLSHHEAIRRSGWPGRVITAYRPDPVVDPEFEDFAGNVARLGALTGRDTQTWRGYLAAHRERRAYFKSFGATSTDHGHPTARTADLSQGEAEALFRKIMSGDFSAEDAELFRAQMLTEMARMSLDDGLVMQIHPGSFRNHSKRLFARFGRDKGADIPMRTGYVRELKPLLDAFGHEPALTIIVFTLDESTYSRELAPLAGVYPALRLGPAWWFFDSPEGMRRFREQTAETAGFYNTVGFNDDTRAFLSIPARHDVARRMDCAFLARLVADRRLDEDEAAEVAVDLAYNLVKKAYRL